MSKVKMRCGRCGKSFTAPKGAKQIFCAECAAKERAARAASKTAPARPAATAAIQAPKISGPGAGILDPKLAAIAPTAAPPDSGPFGPAPRVAAREAARAQHSAHSHEHVGHASEQAHEGERKSRPFGPPKHTKAEHGEHGERSPKPTGPRAPKAPKAPAPVFELTDELRGRIEALYLDLAQPVEFDGIRTRIAAELHIPKPVVKKTIADLRERMQLPSWWDLKAYHGSDEDLERIRTAYLPLLPLPTVGAHKQLAGELRLDPLVVYQGIRRIRAEMRLPQYNPPELHEREQPQNAATAASTAAPGGLGAS